MTAPRLHRVWQRTLVDAGDGRVEVPLRFRVVPGVWPEIAFAPADGTRDEVAATQYEVRVQCETGSHGSVHVDVAGHRVEVRGRVVAVGDERFDIGGDGPIALQLLVGELDAQVIVDSRPLTSIRRQTAEVGTAVSPVTPNVAGFRVGSRPAAVGSILFGDGARLLSGIVYGLEQSTSALYATADAQTERGEVLYSSPRFTVHDGGVVEAASDDVPALVPDGQTIVSPIRVTEEFAWRDTPYGDMTRVADRAELWRSSVEPGRYPRLTSSFRSLDAAFELAVETFQRNASAEFALPGEVGLWSAGYFQGPGEGFGVWRRDTAHVALRAGNLLDRAVARASLERVIDAGFDNGSDGDALPAVAVWDHVLATGDETLVADVWARLVDTVTALDARFDDARGLVHAAQSTSNDLFDEPEVAGFALSTEVYAMQTYRAMSRMAALAGVADDGAERWAARASRMRSAIVEQYWNGRRGYWTPGPTGSEAHTAGLWETSGAEAALWFVDGDGEDADGEARTRSTLRALRSIAMSDYGVVLFPDRAPGNHFTGSVWYCWQAGLASAAARVGDAELVHQLIGQQIRTTVRNKTFYEVTDAASGESWRWPGQLWHAAGFASLVMFGLLGMRYGLDGLAFQPAVAAPFDGVRLTGLRYRSTQLDIEVRGSGTRCTMTIDGRPADRVGLDLSGRHDVVLTMR